MSFEITLYFLLLRKSVKRASNFPVKHTGATIVIRNSSYDYVLMTMVQLINKSLVPHFVKSLKNV